MTKNIKDSIVSRDIKRHLADILLSVSWMDFANRYFHKSSSWFYNKFHERDKNGEKETFNDEELALLRSSLFDLSDRIRRAAEQI